MSYSRTYSRINWENEPSVETPINETNLNAMDYSLYVVDGRVVEHEAEIDALQNYETRASQAATASENSAVQSESWAVGGTGARTGEDTDNSEYYSKLSNSWATGGTGVRSGEDTNNSEYWSGQSQNSANNAANVLTTMQNTYTEYKADFQSDYDDFKADLLTDYNSYSGNLSEEKETYSDELNEQSLDLIASSEAWAVGQRRGYDVDSTDETYHNNSKYYSGQSQNYALNASESATSAAESLANVDAIINEALAQNIPTVYIDFTTGNLMWEGGRFYFTVDHTTGDLMWEISQ